MCFYAIVLYFFIGVVNFLQSYKKILNFQFSILNFFVSFQKHLCYEPRMNKNSLEEMKISLRAPYDLFNKIIYV